DRGERTLVAVTEWGWHGVAAHAAGNQLADVVSLLLGDRCETGQRLAVGSGGQCGIADHKDFRMAEYREVRSDLHPAALGGRHIEPSRHRRGLYTRAPDDIRRLDAPALGGHAVVVDHLYRGREQHLNSHPLEGTYGEGGELFRKPSQCTWPGLDQ